MKNKVAGFVFPICFEINKLMQAVEIVLIEMLKNKEVSLFPAIESVLELNNSSADISIKQIENIKKAIDKNSAIFKHILF